MKYWFLLEHDLSDAIVKGNFGLIETAWPKIDFLKKHLAEDLVDEGIKGDEDSLRTIHKYLQHSGLWKKARNLITNPTLFRQSGNTYKQSSEYDSYRWAIGGVTQQGHEAEWQLVKRRNKHKTNPIYVFVGNLPTRASIADIWARVNSGNHFDLIYNPERRDKKNNRFAFLKLRSGLEVDNTIRALANMILFGISLGFARARKTPPEGMVGINPSITQEQQTN